MLYKLMLNITMSLITFTVAILSFTAIDSYVTIAVSMFVFFFYWIPRIRKNIDENYYGSWKIFLMSYFIKPTNEQLEQLAYDRLGGKIETIPWAIIKEFKKEGRKKAFDGVDWEVLEKLKNLVDTRAWIESKKGFIMHDHDVPEIIKVEKGILTMNGMDYPEGSIIKIKKGMHHDPQNNQAEGELILRVKFVNENI